MRWFHGLGSLVLQIPPLFLLGVEGQSYELLDDYTPNTFLDLFDYYSSYDPTNGHVQYVNQTIANLLNLTTVTDQLVYLKVDTINRYPLGGKGRPSLRLTSKHMYTHGLFILDLEHMPTGCGTWPAYWLLGPNWPNNGEIDMIEGANVDTNNHITLHTSMNCSVSGLNQTATYERADCAYHPPSDNYGCGNTDPRTTSYGAGLNAINGGVYATEWTSNWIRSWFFPRTGAIPSSILNGSPNPAQDFGIPAVNFAGNCNFDAHFNQQQIIFNTDFCGDWAGNTYAYTTCPQTSGLSGWDSCVNFVGNNPQNFTEAYWAIRSLRVYQQPLNLSFSTISVPGASSTPMPLAQVSSIPPIDGGMGQPSMSQPPVEAEIPNSAINYSISATATYEGPNSITTDTEPAPTALACPGADGYTYDSGGGYLYRIECYTDHSGGDMPPPGPYFNIDTFEECIGLCKARSNCVDVSWVIGAQACYLKSSIGASASNHGIYGAFLFATPTNSNNVLSTVSMTRAPIQAPASNHPASSVITTSPCISSPQQLSIQTLKISPSPNLSINTLYQAPTTISAFVSLVLQVSPYGSAVNSTGSGPSKFSSGSSLLSSGYILSPSSNNPSSRVSLSLNGLTSLPSAAAVAETFLSSNQMDVSSPVTSKEMASLPSTFPVSFLSSTSAQIGATALVSVIATPGSFSTGDMLSSTSHISTLSTQSNSMTMSVSNTSTLNSPEPSVSAVALSFVNAVFSGPVQLNSTTGYIEFVSNTNSTTASVTIQVTLSTAATYRLHFALRIRHFQLRRALPGQVKKRQTLNETCNLNIFAAGTQIFTIPLEVLANGFENFDSDPFVPPQPSVPISIVEQCGSDSAILDVDATNTILEVLSFLHPVSSSQSLTSSAFGTAGVSPLSSSLQPSFPITSLPQSMGLGLFAMSAPLADPSGRNSFIATPSSTVSAIWAFSSPAFSTCPRRTTTLSITATITQCPSTCPWTTASGAGSALAPTSCMSTFGLCFDCALTPGLGWIDNCTSISIPTVTTDIGVFLPSISGVANPGFLNTLTPSSAVRVSQPTELPTCVDKILYGDPFNDAYGNNWSIFCDSEFVDVRRDIFGASSFQSSFVNCMTSCDFFNLRNFNEPSPCVAITWTANMTDLSGNNCYLKSSASRMVPRDGYHSGKLNTLYQGRNNSSPGSLSISSQGLLIPTSSPVATITYLTVITSGSQSTTSQIITTLYTQITQNPLQTSPYSNNLSISVSTETTIVTSLSQGSPTVRHTTLIITSTSFTVMTQTSLSTFTTTINSTPSVTTITVTDPVTSTELSTFTSALLITTGGGTVTFVTTSTRLHTVTLTPNAITITQAGSRITTTTFVSYVMYSSKIRTPTFSCRPRKTNYLNGSPAVTVMAMESGGGPRKRSVLEPVFDSSQ